MFKRPHLRAAKRLVNAPLALSLLFLATACGPGPGAVDTDPAEAAVDSADRPLESGDSRDSGGLILPAVWQTNDLGTPISSVAVAGALGSTVAVTFADGGLQFLDLEGERITEKADMDVAQVADGRFLMLQGTPVTVFPGITSDGDLSLFLHGGELPEPLPYPLDSGTDERIEGVCSAPPVTESDGVMRIGFWTRGARRELKTGRLVEVGENLVLLLNEPVPAARDISACMLSETQAFVYSDPAIAAVELQNRSKIYRFLLDDLGGYSLTTSDGAVQAFSVSDGITVRPPARPVDMAGTGDARGGGYPGGVLVIGGQSANGAHMVTFIDPSRVTLEPFGYAPSP
ncbi:MAG: hypothetical protein AAFY82_04615 [Pseudomonadota bacterium]